MPTSTKLTTAAGVLLPIETFGDPRRPTVLLLGAATWSMDWWDADLCALLAGAGAGLHVVRFDQRDTGGATQYPAGDASYQRTDLADDAAAVLDAVDVDQAHVVGVSMGGGIAQLMAHRHRDRVASLTLISTSPVDTTISGLSEPAPEITATASDETQPDWADPRSVVEHIVAGERPFAGPDAFEEDRLRATAQQVVARTPDMSASMTNHFVIEDGDVADVRLSHIDGIPTLVLHGSHDPLFPPDHGRSLADGIPGAQFELMSGVGHQLPPRRTWQWFTGRLAQHVDASTD